MKTIKEKIRRLVLESLSPDNQMDRLAIQYMISGEYENFDDAYEKAAQVLGFQKEYEEERIESLDNARTYYQELDNTRDERLRLQRQKLESDPYYQQRMADEERGLYRMAESYKKLTRKQLRKIILKEFKFTGQDFVDDLDLLGGGPPPAEAEEPGGGGGSGRIHQLVRVNFDPGSEFNPAAYTKTPIDMTPGSPFSKMREIYNSFSNDTKNKLYQMFPGGIDPESPDSETVWEFRSEYINLLNTMDSAVPMGKDYEYFVLYHPPHASYGGEDGANELKALDLYRRVTGYTPDESLLNEYELIMHSASATY